MTTHRHISPLRRDHAPRRLRRARAGLGTELVALGYDRDFPALARVPADAPPALAPPGARRQTR